MAGSNPFAPSAANGFSQQIPSQAPLSSGIAAPGQSYQDLMTKPTQTNVPQEQTAQGGK